MASIAKLLLGRHESQGHLAGRVDSVGLNKRRLAKSKEGHINAVNVSGAAVQSDSSSIPHNGLSFNLTEEVIPSPRSQGSMDSLDSSCHNSDPGSDLHVLQRRRDSILITRQRIRKLQADPEASGLPRRLPRQGDSFSSASGSPLRLRTSGKKVRFRRCSTGAMLSAPSADIKSPGSPLLSRLLQKLSGLGK